MTSTKFTLGYSDGQKTSSKVLRPPGGGTSDIFGAESSGTPRSVRNHMVSNIFGSTQDAPVKNSGENARRGGRDGDSHNRLFGAADRPYTPAKNHFKSNIPLGQTASPKPTANGNGTTELNGHANGKAEKVENNNAQQNGVSKAEPQEPSKIDPEPNSENPSSEQEPSSTFPENQSNAPTEDSLQTTSVEKQLNPLENAPSEETDTVSIAASTTPGNGASSDSIKNVKKDNKEMNGNIEKNDFVIKNDKMDEKSSSSAATSSIVSPVSSISTDCTETSTKSTISSVQSPRAFAGSRNPVTGVGIEMPSYKRTRVVRRDGNPVTGEGYNNHAGGHEVNTTVPCLNGAKQVINKNRIPPGGYSSGLW